MAFNSAPKRHLDRESGSAHVTGFRKTSEKEGLFHLPEDTGQAAWDLDPNEDGDLVIPDDITGRTAEDIPNVSGADVISILLVSIDSQDITFQVDWLPSGDGSINSRSEGTSQSDLFGPATFIRTNFFTVGRHMKVTISSNAGAGTQNRVAGSIDMH